MYPIDPVLAADVAEKAIEVYTAKSTAASRARAAIRATPADGRRDGATDAAGTHRTRQRPGASGAQDGAGGWTGGRRQGRRAPRAGTLARRRRCHGEPLGPRRARAHVDWRIGIEAQYSTERRYALSYVAVELAEHLCSGGDDAAVEDEVARAALALVIGDDAHQPILAVGGLIGTLTIDQARRLVRIANPLV